MAHLPMGKIVYINEFGVPRLGRPNSVKNAKQHLTAQMFTDAVFNQDIRVIQTIINRIDGGLPKDVEVNYYQTLFGDCMNQVLDMETSDQVLIKPEDSVMLALCKSLYDIAASDIYHETFITDAGEKVSRKKTPSTEDKQRKDAALRMVLERAGGRKTTPLIQKSVGSVQEAEWIPGSLPAPEN